MDHFHRLLIKTLIHGQPWWWWSGGGGNLMSINDPELEWIGSDCGWPTSLNNKDSDLLSQVFMGYSHKLPTRALTHGQLCKPPTSASVASVTSPGFSDLWSWSSQMISSTQKPTSIASTSRWDLPLLLMACVHLGSATHHHGKWRSQAAHVCTCAEDKAESGTPHASSPVTAERPFSTTQKLVHQGLGAWYKPCALSGSDSQMKSNKICKALYIRRHCKSPILSWAGFPLGIRWSCVLYRLGGYSTQRSIK